MEFERVPGRQAPSVPAQAALPLAKSERESPSLNGHSQPHFKIRQVADAVDDLIQLSVDGPVASCADEALQRRWDVLAEREGQLEESRRTFAQSVAAWETQRRLWEADFAERLERLEEREARVAGSFKY